MHLKIVQIPQTPPSYTNLICRILLGREGRDVLPRNAELLPSSKSPCHLLWPENRVLALWSGRSGKQGWDLRVAGPEGVSILVSQKGL